MASRLFHVVHGDVRRVNKFGEDIEYHEWLTESELGPKLAFYSRKAKKQPCFWYEVRDD